MTVKRQSLFLLRYKLLAINLKRNKSPLDRFSDRSLTCMTLMSPTWLLHKGVAPPPRDAFICHLLSSETRRQTASLWCYLHPVDVPKDTQNLFVARRYPIVVSTKHVFCNRCSPTRKTTTQTRSLSGRHQSQLQYSIARHYGGIWHLWFGRPSTWCGLARRL